jgi:hypothetical protein
VPDGAGGCVGTGEEPGKINWLQPNKLSIARVMKSEDILFGVTRVVTCNLILLI